MLSFYRSVFSSLVAQGISMLLIFVASVFMTRALGVEGRGIATWVTSLNAIGSILVQGGMVHAASKFAAESPQRSGDIMIITFLICAGLSIVVIPAFLFIDIPEAIMQDHLILITGLFTIPVVAMAQCYGNMIMGLGRKKAFDLIPLVQGGVQSLIVFVVILAGIAKPIYAVIALIAPAFFRIAVALYSMREHVSFKLKEPGWILKNFKSFMFFNYISSLFLLMINALPPLLTGSLSTLHQTGLFAACIPFLEALYRIPSMISAHSIKSIVNEKDINERWKFKVRLMLHTFIFMSAIAIILFFIANWMITFIYGAGFEDSAVIFKILLPGTIFAAMFNVAQSFIVIEDKGWKISASPILSAVILFAGSICIIPQYGAAGAAAIWSLSCLIATACAYIILLRIKRQTP